MTRDWRLDNAKCSQGASFRFKHYKRRSETSEHEHCVGCWTKFMEEKIAPDLLTEGYATDNDQWVCAECFRDLKESTGWKLLS